MHAVTIVCYNHSKFQVDLLDGYGEIESKPFHTTYGDDDLYHTHAFDVYALLTPDWKVLRS